jgi:hypothetical protein
VAILAFISVSTLWAYALMIYQYAPEIFQAMHKNMRKFQKLQKSFGVDRVIEL